MSEQERTLVFFGAWAALGAMMGLLMWKGSLDAKRRWFPRLTVLVGVVFVGFVYWTMRQASVLYMLVPAVLIITVVNIRSTKFCQQCGAYNRSNAFSYKAVHCRSCGASLS